MKKSYFCNKLETNLHFLPDQIHYCCSCAECPGVKFNSPNEITKKFIIDGRKKFIKLFDKGIIPEECGECKEYQEKNENIFSIIFNSKSKKKINSIIINHFKQCDCACVYCSQKVIYDKETKDYDILPIIKSLYKDKMIDEENLKVEFQGGNISMLKEFEPIINEFRSHNCNKFLILTNAIKNMPILEEIHYSEGSHICVSLDCGSAETYKKMKKVDAFNQVMDNITRIHKNANVNIMLKYIIVKDYNDNLDELNLFLEIAKSFKNKIIVVLDIDYRDILINKGTSFTVPEVYYAMINRAKEFCEQNNIFFYLPEYTKSVMDKGSV